MLSWFRILIIDWDVHHGNATQHMFYDDNRFEISSLSLSLFMFLYTGSCMLVFTVTIMVGSILVVTMGTMIKLAKAKVLAIMLTYLGIWWVFV